MTPIRIKLQGKMYSRYTPRRLLGDLLDDRPSGMIEFQLIHSLPTALRIPWEDQFEAQLDWRIKKLTKPKP